ncbi:MAG: serine/threonine-protein kinase [Planctomycetota bacterium]
MSGPAPHSSSGDRDAVQRLLDRCLDAEEAQWAGEVERACHAHPEHAAELRRRFALLAGIGMAGGGGGEATDAFGGFDLLRELGRGGMGVVHLARQRSTGRLCALKVIRRELLGQDKARQRFRREVEAVSSLEHPGVCTVYEAGEVDGAPFVAMRFVDGRTLADLLAERGATGPRDLAATLQLFERIALALHAAHEAGVLHRDVKPANIMVDRDGAPVVLDFGLARPEQDTGEQLTLSADQLGTPAYMSPEQVAGARRVDRRTDVWSLGVTLYEFVAGGHPFAAPTRDQLYQNILAGRCEPLSRCTPQVSRDLGTAVHTAMAIDADRRYETAAAFAEDLRRIRTHEPILARRPTPLQRFARWCRREPLVASLLAALLIVAAVSVWFAIDADRSRRAAEQAHRAQTIEATTAGRVTDFLVELFEVADGSSYRGDTVTAREVLDQGFRRIEQELGDEPVVRARLMATMGKVYQYLSAFDRAGALFEQSLQLRRAHGATPLELAVSVRNLGELKHYMQDYAAADALYRDALALLEGAGLGDGAEAATTVDLRGRAQRDLGDLDAAAAMQQRALSMRRRLADNALDLANSHQSAALLSIYKNDGETARDEFEAAIALRRGALGERSSRMAELLHGLASAQLALGQLDAARDATQRALELTREVLGDQHIGVGFCLSQLGTIAADTGDLDAARRYLMQAREVFTTTFGPDSREVATQIHNLGTVELDLKHLDEAERLLQQAYAMRQKALVEGSPELGFSLTSLGDVAADRGDLRTALQRYRDGYAILAGAMGEDAPRVKRAAASVAGVLDQLGDLEAAAWHERAR